MARNEKLGRVCHGNNLEFYLEVLFSPEQSVV